MKVTCEPRNIRLLEGKGNCLASASIKLDDAFVVRNLTVMNSQTKGLFVNMPCEKGKKDGKEAYFDTAYPLSKELREQISGAVLDAYNELVKGRENQAAATAETTTTTTNSESEEESEEFEMF